MNGKVTHFREILRSDSESIRLTVAACFVSVQFKIDPFRLPFFLQGTSGDDFALPALWALPF
jgi:hypothetical protein